jgi:hypothetical protein
MAGSVCGRRPAARRVLAAALLTLLPTATGCTGARPAALADSGPPPASVGAAQMTFPPPVDVVVGQELWTADGRRLSLGWSRSVDSVYRVPAGWLVLIQSAEDRSQSLFLLTDDGDHHALLPRAGGLAISDDGRRFAWRAGDELIVGRLKGREIVPFARTAGVGDFWPQALLDHAVLLALPGGDGPNAYDLWFPARGPFHPTPRTGLQILGSTRDSRRLVGWVPSDADPCLALFDPASLALTNRACGLGAIPWAGTPVSPDGRWLLVSLYATSDNPPAKSGTGNPTALVDLTTVFDAPAVVATWPDEPDQFVRLDRCVWSDNRTVYCSGGAGLARLSLDRPGVIDWFHLDGIPVMRRGA